MKIISSNKFTKYLVKGYESTHFLQKDYSHLSALHSIKTWNQPKFQRTPFGPLDQKKLRSKKNSALGDIMNGMWGGCSKWNKEERESQLAPLLRGMWTH